MGSQKPAESVKAMLARLIALCEQVMKSADESSFSKMECAKLIKLKTESLADLLRQVARIGSDLYERPARRMLPQTEQVIEKALALTLKSPLFIVNPTKAFNKVATQLENSIGDISWILAISSSDRSNDDYLGLPPIAANEPILWLIWQYIATLSVSWSTLDARAYAAASLASLTKNNDWYGKLIIEEGGVRPLLRFCEETSGDGPENATRALALLACHAEKLQLMADDTVCSAMYKILKEEQTKTQSVDGSEAVAKRNTVRLLVSHLCFETVGEQESKKGRGHNVEKDTDLPSSWYMPSSTAAKAVVHELLKIVEEAESDLLLPSVKAMGCLARTFRSTENRIIAALVKLLNERETNVMKEAVQALVKFAGPANCLHVDHSKAILDSGGARYLVQLVLKCREHVLRVDALVLLCYIAQHVPESEALVHADVLGVLRWVSVLDLLVQDSLVSEAMARLQLYQSRGSTESAQESILTIVEEEDYKEEYYKEKDLDLTKNCGAFYESTHKQHIVPTPGPVDLTEKNPNNDWNQSVDNHSSNGEKSNLVIADETTRSDTSSNTLHSSTEGHLSYRDKRRAKIFDLINDAVNDLKEASVFEYSDIEKELKQLLDLASQYGLQVQPLYSLLNEMSRVNESIAFPEFDQHTLAKETLEKQKITLSKKMVELRVTWDANKERHNHITEQLKKLHDEEECIREILVSQQFQLEDVEKAIVANEEALDATSSRMEALKAGSSRAEEKFKALVANFTFELAQLS